MPTTLFDTLKVGSLSVPSRIFMVTRPRCDYFLTLFGQQKGDVLTPARETLKGPALLVNICVEIKFYGAFIDATPARWRGDAGSSPPDGARTAASSPRNDLVKSCWVHPPHWLISTQVNMGFEVDEAKEGVAAGRFDAVAFGTKFLANPDLPARIAAGAALNDPKADLFYTGKVGDLTYTGPEGYTDYPPLTPN